MSSPKSSSSNLSPQGAPGLLISLGRLWIGLGGALLGLGTALSGASGLWLLSVDPLGGVIGAAVGGLVLLALSALLALAAVALALAAGRRTSAMWWFLSFASLVFLPTLLAPGVLLLLAGLWSVPGRAAYRDAPAMAE